MSLIPQCRPYTSQLRSFTTTKHFQTQTTYTPPGTIHKDLKPLLAHKSLQNHPQAPIPTKGLGPFTKNAITGKRLTYIERREERAKEYLYERPDLNQPLPPLLLNPPGLKEEPVVGVGHGRETRKWWQRELEIWFGRYHKPFDIKAQLERHRNLYDFIL